MKKIIIPLFVLLTTIVHAQNDKTLFWEISGNGLTKNSYVYGTMHVNDKVSYHLSDTFFTKLLAADMVANESDPETWDEIEDLMQGNDLVASSKFYSEFYLTPITKDNLLPLFQNKNNYFDKLLSGFNEQNADYQESTVLDSFIYQTGRKYNKKTVGLESAKESMISIMKVTSDDARPKDDNRQALLKILKNRNYYEVMKDLYREKDITMLDSLSKLIISKKAHDALIVNRNIVMVKSMDSLAKTGSLFSAVGAGHLGGKKGIIVLLREKGYTVTPIFDMITESGKKQKKKIEDFFPNPNFVTSSTKDQMVQMPLNAKIIHNGEDIGSPDFTNGGVLNIKRIPLRYFLKKEEATYDPKVLDSLFFENIPGDILEKNYFDEENAKGYDIKSVTKTGNSQHYRFYITPLEIIGISMTGVGNYVRQYENDVFNNIKIKPLKSTWERISPEKGGFSVEVPSFNSVTGNSQKEVNNIQIEAYNPTDKSYYFLTEKTLSDNEFLENSEYEQKQIHYEFYLQHEVDSLDTKFDKLKQSFTSSSKIGDKKVKLKSFIKGDKYYLLGTISADDKNSTTFFNSFLFEKSIKESVTKTLTDTIANFKIAIPEKQNQKLFLNLFSQNFKTKNTFLSKRDDFVFNSESGKNVNLAYYKYSKYESVANIDSIKVNFRKFFLKDEDYFDTHYNYNYDDEYDEERYDNESSLVRFDINSKKGFSKSLWYDLMKDKEDTYEMLTEGVDFDKEKNTYTFNALVSKPNSSQAIKYKILFKEDSYYMLSTLVDKNYKNDDAFIEKTFNSLETTSERKFSVFDDKIAVFISDAKSEKDTIRYSAFKSIHELDIVKKDFESVKEFINTFKFKENETEAIGSLIEKIGFIQDPKVVEFLEDYYKKENTKTTLQFSVLTALANQKSKLGYQKILELLEYDLPISDEQYEINSLFYKFSEDAENSKELFPKLFQFYTINEYNSPIIEFCNLLLEKDLVSIKKINSYKKMILTNAKLEYKRVLSWNEKNNHKKEEITPSKITEDAVEEIVDEVVEDVAELTVAIDDDEEDYSYNSDSAPIDNLVNYVNLLYHFPIETSITDLLQKIKNLDIEQLNLELLRLDIINNKINDDEIQLTLDNPKTRYATLQLLLNNNKKGLVTLSDDEIAKSALLNFENPEEKDSISFLEKRIVDIKGRKVAFYFYQIEKKIKKSKTTEKELYPIAFIMENNKINPLAYKAYQSQVINEDDKLTKLYETVINKEINENHPRASFEKIKPENNFYNGYDDY